MGCCQHSNDPHIWQNAGTFLSSWGTTSFSKRTLLHAVGWLGGCVRYYFCFHHHRLMSCVIPFQVNTSKSNRTVFICQKQANGREMSAIQHSPISKFVLCNNTDKHLTRLHCNISIVTNTYIKFSRWQTLVIPCGHYWIHERQMVCKLQQKKGRIKVSSLICH
jgi:hypothetical protein